jgi:crotonobetainyl-CoA:carnitine CoA-transferase CaiB-like acyl-CoA transferase
VVLDASRMLPGAVLARMLLELGARLIKIETPRGGDPLRSLEPTVDGIGAGFAEFFRGAESVCLDLSTEPGAGRFRKLADRADVLVESFRPGRLGGWGLGPAELLAARPSLVICSLVGFAPDDPAGSGVGHDLNLVAASGLLERLGGAGKVPRVQLADVTAALLACSAVLGALLGRARDGRGAHVVQPLASGPLPFLTLALADAAAGGEPSEADRLLAGECPAYHLYECGDGERIALGALEPKFWSAFVGALGLPDLEAAGLDSGPEGDAAARRVQEKLAERPREHWLALARELELPVSPVNALTTTSDGPGCYLPSIGRRPARPAPRLGEHTDSVLAAYGID